MSRKACMGGWCSLRSKCPHYAVRDARDPAERLCVPGNDGVGMAIPMHWHSPVGSWETRNTQPLMPSAAFEEAQ